MDALNDLPDIPETASSPAELQVIQRFFDSQLQAGPGKAGGRSALKAAIYLTLLFLVLANPLCDVLFQLIPKCEGAYMQFAVKLALFFILAFAIEKWAI